MLALAWATLPDLESYRTGIIMVGIARCIAMVMIWNRIARGDSDICAFVVILNSILQLVLYAPFSVWFVNVISGSKDFNLNYSDTAIAVAIVRALPIPRPITMFWADPQGLKLLLFIVTVSGHSASGRAGDEVRRTLSRRPTVPPDKVPTPVQPVVADRSSVHNHHHLCRASAQYPPQPRASLPDVCPPRPLLRYNVDGDVLRRLALFRSVRQGHLGIPNGRRPGLHRSEQQLRARHRCLRVCLWCKFAASARRHYWPTGRGPRASGPIVGRSIHRSQASMGCAEGGEGLERWQLW
jgi:hypothetical protein